MPGAPFWFAGRRAAPAIVIPDTLITSGLYASLLLAEGTGTTTAAENDASRVFTLTSDSAAIPTWRAGGGLTYPGPTSQLKRLSETAMDVTDGVTLTIAFKPNTPTALGRLFQRQPTTGGYLMQVNPTGKPIQFSTKTSGNVGTTATVSTYVDQTVQVICVSSVLATGALGVNFQGTEVAPSVSTTNAWANGAGANILIGYTLKGDIYYACIHNRAMSALERAQMVKYAQKICRQRGLIA